ncbi:MAG TPA: amidohydrolase family protein [Longimicrobium sp.]|nr:amidohydrolase family protein [Longimicrobium sp.]
MRTLRSVALSIVGASVLAGAAHPLRAQAAPGDTGRVVERGRFRLHKFQQEIGTETYVIRDLDSVLVVQDTFHFTDRGTDVPLSTTLRLRKDLTPVHFAIEGSTARGSSIDTEITVANGQATVREGTETRTVAAPGRFFTIAGYAPVATQMLLLRYLARHPGAAVSVLPRGSVSVERRGVDTVDTTSGRHVLTRYSIGGLIWGRESAWTDSAGQLVAVKGVDAEFDHFEALRDGYQPALAALVASSASDGMRVMAELAARTTTPAAAGTLAITGATLIDGTGAAPVRDAVVVVRDGRIVAAGPRARVAVPAGARVLDARGKFVIPGLWDMHAHFAQVEWGPIYLAAGVTTVRDVGNELEFIRAARDAVRDGRGVGPRLVLAGVVDGDGPIAIGVQRIRTADEARAWVRRYHDAGFQQIKIYSSMSVEMIRAVAQEAHRLGMTVTGHVPQGLDAFQAVEAGMDQLNHATYVVNILRPTPAGPPAPGDTLPLDLATPQARRAIAFLKQHGTVVDPTLTVFELFTHPARVPFSRYEPGIVKVAPELSAGLNSIGAPPEREAVARARFERMVDAVRALHRAGVTIVAGTDQTVPGHSLHRELELYVRAGMTPMEALQSATLVPARVMGMERETGSVQPGKAADLVLLDADPLANITNTRRIHAVVAGGRVYEPAVLWRAAEFQP